MARKKSSGRYRSRDAIGGGRAGRPGSSRDSIDGSMAALSGQGGKLDASHSEGGKRSRSADKASTAPLQKNEEVTAEIVGLTHDGEGVGRTDGFTLFIRGALPGEKVRAKVTKLKKTYGYARLLEHVEASGDRTSPICAIYKECGGCQLQHYSYAGQLAWKRRHVVENLQRIGKLKVAGEHVANRDAEEGQAAGRGSEEGQTVDRGEERVEGRDAEADRTVERASKSGQANRDSVIAADEQVSNVSGPDSPEQIERINSKSADGVIVHPTIGMADPWRYRNKAAVPVGVSGRDTEEAGLIAGFYARGTHRIIDMDDCHIQHSRNDEVISIVKAIARELRIAPYDEGARTGLLRHVMVRIGVVSGEVMVVLVTNGKRMPRKAEWIEKLRAAIPDLKSIVQNVNERDTNAIFGDETIVLWGSDVIYDELDGIRFAISARSFYQVNPAQTIALYRKAVEYAGLTGKERVIDAYCGIGTISLFLARHAGHVYGVEIVPEAIEDAKRNAALNGMDNTTFDTGPAEVVIPRWRQEGVEADVIVVDPPRKGCDPALLDTILAMRPERIVYVSCNPSTLARDLRILEDGGYRTVEVTPVDMFPQTVHVECVVGICRVDT
ncbi:23S rRNA (uracil(1939)-C(5))-methyltransferase RlmD [Paenibacillus sp. J5C2022]|uniref:23S rRNA (uracil(1939)-C(5))-methyltransferase RlmD n=1 Tax=Paenibacillus sp. J5C2022 TaxID=2977129 RepID=UPI0021D24BF1|nr:23S rRNA (uracil(1939)-C(5))-methyltransferase RlmD [Paenibacillus sp. J5C2022]